MFQIKRILCPVDFSEFSQRAFQYSCSIAKRCGSTVLLEHVIEPPYMASPFNSYISPELIDRIYEDMNIDARRKLNELIGERKEKALPMHGFVRTGIVAGEILEFATQHDADLIVMGTHGRRGLDHIALGSVTEKVLRKARCPVLAIHPRAEECAASDLNEEPVLRNILYCTDFSDFSAHALGYALAFAAEYDAEITVLHVQENLPVSVDVKAETAAVISQMEEQISHSTRGHLRIRYIVRSGRAFQQIISSSLEYKADMIVMGVAGRNALDLALFGSTTHRVIQMGSCPVLTVPAKAPTIQQPKEASEREAVIPPAMCK